MFDAYHCNMSIHFFTHWSACLSVYLSVCLSSSCLPIFLVGFSYTSMHLNLHMHISAFEASTRAADTSPPSTLCHELPTLTSTVLHEPPTLASFPGPRLQLPSVRSRLPTPPSGAAVSASLQQTLLVSSSLCWSFITLAHRQHMLRLSSQNATFFLHVLKVIRLHGWGPRNITPDLSILCSWQLHCVSNLSNDSSKHVQQAVANAA